MKRTDPSWKITSIKNLFHFPQWVYNFSNQGINLTTSSAANPANLPWFASSFCRAEEAAEIGVPSFEWPQGESVLCIQSFIGTSLIFIKITTFLILFFSLDIFFKGQSVVNWIMHSNFSFLFNSIALFEDRYEPGFN